MAKISVVVNAHQEGELVQFSLRSAMLAIEDARANGIEVDSIVIIDRGDQLTTEFIASSTSEFGADIHQVDFGDPAMSRNYAIQAAQSEFVAFLDADDLWCRTWLTKCYRFAHEHGERTICHPEMNLIFGNSHGLFPHPDQTAKQFSLQSLRCINYWTVLSFARRAVYKDCPFQINRIEDGFGYEDWAWNCEAIYLGYTHRVVPETTHFLRRKQAEHSRLAKSNESFCLRTPARLFRRH